VNARYVIIDYENCCFQTLLNNVFANEKNLLSYIVTVNSFVLWESDYNAITNEQLTSVHTAQIETGLSSVLRPCQHSMLYGRRFLQVKRPNQQYQSTEGTNSTQTNQTYNKQTWSQNTASPLV